MQSINGVPHRSTQTAASPKKSFLVKPKPALTPTTPSTKRKLVVKQDEKSGDEAEEQTTPAPKRQKSANDVAPASHKKPPTKFESIISHEITEDEQDEGRSGRSGDTTKDRKPASSPMSASKEKPTTIKPVKPNEVHDPSPSVGTSSLLTPEEVADLHGDTNDTDFNSFFTDELERACES